MRQFAACCFSLVLLTKCADKQFYFELFLTMVWDLSAIVQPSLFSDSCGLAGSQLPLS